MKNRVLQFVLALSCGLSAVAVHAANPVGYTPVRGARPPMRMKANVTYHGGPVIVSPRVAFIFWGPSFTNAASPDYAYAQTLQSYRNQLGTTPEFNVITQYSGIQLANLGAGTPDWFDTSAPPANVTDALVQSKVNQYLSLYPFNSSTIYEVVLPSTSYSTNPSLGQSCGGPSTVTYCAYHNFFTSGSSVVKYSVQPYASCSGCQSPGWTAAQNQEHFIVHETREATTDPQLNAWFDPSGNEADDLCNWFPAPFIGTGGYAYQYEWSNASSSCVQGIPVVGTCTPSSTKLCLQNSRFEVTVDFVNNGTTQSAQTKTYSDKSGFFTFFDPANPEVGVKIVDGRPVNAMWWIYHGALTSLQYTVHINDTVAHALKTYTRPAATGTSLCGGADAGAFFANVLFEPESAEESGAAFEFPDDAPGDPFTAKAACVSSSTRLCLLGSRFQVEVQRGGVNQGAALLSDQSGVFWFFDSQTAEVPVKVIDGRPVNSNFWFFFGSLTDQSYQITVTDTATGRVKTYTPPAALCGTADTAAFPGP
jgi:hypothetical protein